MVIQGISAFFGTAGFAILFYLPKKYLIHAGATGSLGWVIYLLVLQPNNDKVLANFAATLFVALTAHILARVYKTPVTMFLIPGVIPLVPGAGMYHIVQSIIDNSVEKTSYYFYQTLQMAGSIALGIFIMDTVFRIAKRSKNKKNPF
ncbi:MAG TPA: threonine/serine exporter family protein [Mobilitalea sp.]|nr:threonine/serine exporter family protein [Mobilitalea sp.]